MSTMTAEILSRVERGIAPIDLPQDVKRAVLANFEDWLETEKLEGLSVRSNYRPILRWMVEAEKFDLLVDSFYQVIPFGTGGRRGPVGVGPNRINPYTIASSVQGHVEYLRLRFGAGEPLKVVIANDVRAFHDIRGTYPDDLENPLLGLSSQGFARIAAAVYAAAGVEVYALPEGQRGYISTPELSFLIRWVGAHGGINVSASHNHPDDNGSKFYNSEGGQEIPPDDEALASIVDRVKEINVRAADAVANPQLIHAIPADARQAFIDMNLGLRLRKPGGAGRFVFTALHGTGVETVGRCLEAMGYAKGRQLFYVDKQCEPRSDFRHVLFRSPNPEVPESLQMGLELAADVGGDLLLATDPDADRLGGAARKDTGYAFLTGNELAAVLARYRLDALAARGCLPEQPLCIKTEVTTNLVRRLFEARNGVVIGDLLVGFKYIAAVLGSLERVGQYRNARVSLDDFVLAAEESHGFMLTPEIRDKDAAGAAVVLAELTSELVERGETVHDYLVDTYKRYGYHANTVRSTVMQGAAGSAKIRKILQLLRSDPPTVIGERAVLTVNDYQDEIRHGPFLSETDRSARNLISYTLRGGIKATVRPSGTEPKIKLYIELAAAPLGAAASAARFAEHRQAVDREVKQFSNRFLAQMLSLVGVCVPDYAFEISDLVPLPWKVDFCDRFLPEFGERTQAVIANHSAEDELGRWVDETLRPYGPDARVLVRRGFQAYAATCAESDVLAVQRRVFADS